MNDRQVHIEHFERQTHRVIQMPRSKAHELVPHVLPEVRKKAHDFAWFYSPLFSGIQLRGVLLVLSALAMTTALCYLGLWAKERFNVDLQPVVAVAGNKQ